MPPKVMRMCTYGAASVNCYCSYEMPRPHPMTSEESERDVELRHSFSLNM